MSKYVVLLNPIAGHGGAEKVQEKLTQLLPDDELIFENLTTLNTAEYIEKLDGETKIILAGGDGTINKFVNTVDCDMLHNELYLYAAGSGNDYFNDLRAHVCELFPVDSEFDTSTIRTTNTLFQINKYVKNLPTVEVQGKTYKFANGVGYGIDGYCCEVGDKLKAEGKKVNYTGIAIKGLLFHFKPRNAEIIVDGVSYNFKKVWIAPTMHGRYYGGGMIPTPNQDRSTGDKLSLCVLYNSGKISTLMTFPKIFKGEHVKKEKMVKILEGKTITVKFDKPCALQIDGETVLNVTEYTATCVK